MMSLAYAIGEDNGPMVGWRGDDSTEICFVVVLALQGAYLFSALASP